MKRKTLMIILAGVFIIILSFVGYLLYLKMTDSSMVYKYQDYKIRVIDNVYCPESKIGCAEIEIEDCEKGFEKLIHTSDDMFHNGDNTVVADEYIIRTNEQYKCKSYETKIERRTQHLKIYYVDAQMQKKPESLRLELVQTKDASVKLRIPMVPENDYETRRFVCGGQQIYVTSKGILFDVEGTDMYDEPNMTAVTMNIEWPGKRGAITLKNDVEAGMINGREIVKTKLKWIEGSKRFYAVELENWEKIEKIVIGGNIFEQLGTG